MGLMMMEQHVPGRRPLLKGVPKFASCEWVAVQKVHHCNFYIIVS